MYSLFICGSKFFGESVLKLALERGLTVLGVSAPAGEVEDRLYNAAIKLGIPARPARKTIGEDDVPDNTDLIVCAYSHEYINGPALRKARYGGVGYHPSLLPELRGRHAVEDAVKLGLEKTGGSIYVLDSGWDTGAVLLRDTVNVDAGETPEHLWRDGLQPLGLRLYARFFDDLLLFGPVWNRAYVESYHAPEDGFDY